MAVFCIATNEFEAETIVIDLKGAGFADKEISVLLPDKTGTEDAGHEQHKKTPAAALMGAGALGVVGGILGWLAGGGLLTNAGAGTFVTAGPAAAALGGVAVGTVVGAIVGVWSRTGGPEYVAKGSDGKLEMGNILISVHADDTLQARRVEKIFSGAGAQDIATTSEAEVAAKRFGQSRQETHALI
jgi:hypothetical protein